MKFSRLIICLLVMACFMLPQVGTARADRQDYDLWFPVGERLYYRAYWGIVYVATAVISSFWDQDRDGNDVIVLRVEAKSNRVLSAIFPVDNLMETRVNPETFLPISYMRRWRHGRREAHEITTFNHEEGKAYVHDILDDERYELKIDPDTRDLISFTYYMRKKELDPRTITYYRVMSDDKIYDLELETGSVERIRTDKHGRMDVLRVEPKAEFEGVVRDRGQTDLWISRDPRRLSVLIEVTVPVARVRLRLSDVRGPGKDFWTGHSHDDPGAPVRR